MLKKIALIGVFAFVSVVSFNSRAASTESHPSKAMPSVGSPVMKGMCWFYAMKC